MTLACRFCSSPLRVTFADLGMSPLANRFVPAAQASAMEPFYPLHAYVCEACYLVQLQDFSTPEDIFSDYLYFSSFSDSWLDHSRQYAERMISKENLSTGSLVVEIASNDGYLLQYFQQSGIRVLGVEPARNVAKYAVAKGVPTEVAFFGCETAKRLRAEGIQADVMAANNVLAHVPDINDFVGGVQEVLKPQGVMTFEFPHLLRQIEQVQFDTIYHEHYSYLSLLTAQKIFATHGLRIFDVEEISTHGGSVRVYVCHMDASRQETARPGEVIRAEIEAGLQEIVTYERFATMAQKTKYDLLTFLIQAKREGKRVAAYGAPAKGNTLLNYCGVKSDLVEFTVDRSPHKQGRLLPGTRIPIRAPEAVREAKPDYLLILPWNLRPEIMQQMADIRTWGGRFVTPIPTVEVHA